MNHAILDDVHCEFPGDIRPLLSTDLRQVGDATPEQRHTNDWLLREVVNAFHHRVRRMDADRAWKDYATLAEKFGFTPEEASQRAAGARMVPAPSPAKLERHYTGRGLDEFKFVPADLIATQIIPHLGLSTLEVSGARLYSVQERSGVELNIVAECFLFGDGTMRDFRQLLGGKLCRKCNDYFYPGELVCRECGSIDWSKPIRSSVIALIIFFAVLGGRFAEFLPAFPFWIGLIVAGVVSIHAIRGWKAIYDYYYKPLF